MEISVSGSAILISVAILLCSLYRRIKSWRAPKSGNPFRYNNKLFMPGEYEVRILYDTNQNGVWDPGDFSKHLQPEIVVPIKRKINVKSDWDNEVDNTL